MSTQPTPNRLTFEEYLAIEEKAQYKSEYRGSQMVAMAGGSEAHARLSFEIAYLLRNRTKEECRIYGSDLRVYVPSVNESMYPDAMAICGAPEYHGNRTDVVLNPTVIIEVLSPSTADYDRGMKAQFYRQIASLRALVLVDSSRPHVQVQNRVENGDWLLKEFIDSRAVVRMDRWEFTVAEIYTDILVGPAVSTSGGEVDK